jgi:selenophosphate synthase
MLMFDPQTSGGMLFGVPPDKVESCLESAKNRQIPLWQVGEVTSSGLIEVGFS